jgi:hypothetical protein
MEQEVQALLAQAHARSGLRPVLRGEPQPGKAWEKYDEAIGRLGGYQIDYVSRSPYPPDSPEWSAEVHKKFSPSAGPLREGTRRADGRRHREWQSPERPKSTSIVDMGRNQAWIFKEGGKHREAAEWLLDLLQMCGDIARNSSQEDAEDACGRRARVLEDLKKMLLAQDLTAPECAQVARELERVVQAFPSLGDILINTAMSRGCMYIDLAPKGSMLQFPEKPTWRFLFSERVMISSAFFEELACVRKIAEAEGKPWKEASDIERNAVARLTSINNPILKRHAAWITAGTLPLRTREQLAQMQLLRALAHFFATGAVPELPDPFGTTLRHVLKDGSVKIWSVGPDGADDGGDGDWLLKDGRDLVIK